MPATHGDDDSHQGARSRWPDHPEWQRLVNEVKRLGRETGHEHAAALTAAGTRLGAIASGGRHTVVVSDDVRPWLGRPGAELAICHNHPAHPGEVPHEMSLSDVALLGCPGVRSVHMVSGHEPEGFSIACRLVSMDADAWMAAARLARDIAHALTAGVEACAYLSAHGLDALDPHRLFVRLLHRVGLIDWAHRFDGATATYERAHGWFLDELADAGAEEFARRVAAVTGGWVAEAEVEMGLAADE